jgi:hypothetical protein
MRYFDSIISVLIVAAAFICYYYISRLKVIRDYLTDKLEEEQGQLRLVLFQRLCGVLFFGIIPAFFFLFLMNSSIFNFVLKIHFDLYSFIAIISLGFIAFLINYFITKSPENLKMYPQIRTKKWTYSLLVLSGLSWMAYLFAYEYLFRGILLFSCVGELGVLPAIIVNVSIYGLVHIYKGTKETIGAIPMGIILCILTLHFGTIWAAFWIHCCLALSNEWFSIKYNPEIKIQKTILFNWFLI